MHVAFPIELVSSSIVSLTRIFFQINTIQLFRALVLKDNTVHVARIIMLISRLISSNEPTARDGDEDCRKPDLENLSPEAIRNMIRLLIDRPGSADWKAYLRFKDVEKLYLGKGYASEHCRLLISRMSTHRGWGENRMAIRKKKKKTSPT